MTVKQASQVASQISEVRGAIRDSPFSEDYKRQLFRILNDALDSRKPSAIAMAMRNVNSVVRPNSSETFNSIKDAGPLPETIFKKKPNITSGEINDAMRARTVDPTSVGLPTIENPIGSPDYNAEMKENRYLQDSNPTLWKIKYGEPDCEVRQLKDDNGMFIAVFGKNGLGEAIPIGVKTAWFFDSGSVRITKSVAEKAIAHYERELGNSPNETHRSYLGVGEFAKVRIVVDVAKTVHAIAFYDSSPEALGRIANAKPAR
jgi:hypothetical protein